MSLPFAESAEQNKAVIFEVIKSYLLGEVLEIGSGTGQHAVHFAGLVPEVIWQTSDLPISLPAIEAWIAESGLGNLPPPIALDAAGSWPEHQYDLVYTANTFHIMSAPAVDRCITGIAGCLRPGGIFSVYGPFNYDGSFTSESNARFDGWLKSRDPASGIRDFEWLDQLAKQADLEALDDVAMPANNRILIWQKRTL